MKRPKIIFFDVGGTLIYPEPSVGRVYHEVGNKHGVMTPSAEAVSRAFQSAVGGLSEGQTHSKRNARKWWRGQVGRTFALLGHEESPALDRIFEELFHYFARPEAWRLFDDVDGALERLKAAGLRLGIISNWDYRLLRILAGFKILEQFDPVVISFDVGHEKPEKKIFLLACKRAGVNPLDALMVGDSPEEDFEGARAAGLDAVIVNRRLKSVQEHSLPGLDHLPRFLEL